MVGQMLLKLDHVGRILHPSFDPNAAVRRDALAITQQRFLQSTTRGAILDTVIELRDFASKLPGRANRILDAIANGELKVRVDAVDEAQLMEGAQKIANRIALGLVLAGLIVGAALIMRVETSFRILGYPGLAMLLFMSAAAGAFVLAWQILFRDVRHGPVRNSIR
jgi:ubiquinone biosynthesis protein